ncbi:PREDICTED: uncharacterized protein LOC109223928 isoform X1 [Nicotiana attenuata]|uniref:FCP1 homology domain-containing protein n=1 Tax=Nicotiana attenuata TaxID=49451 RepID=A0A1J6JA90_NICAT|nr:PREDICTED: uncharacterized protein LOC109223928 isoform X1 [Nicotiana attenuata]OIT07731.1 hypothetical protein A4A49_16917 [Nicotiana attenuata]
MKRMHSSRIVIQALPAPGAPDYWDAEKGKGGTKLRKLNSKAAFSRGHHNKNVDDLIPWQAKRMRNKQNRRVFCIGNADHVLGAPLRIMGQEKNSHLWSSENIKSSTKVGSCIADLSAWKVKKRRSILESKCNASENNVTTCEQANAAAITGKNRLDKGRSSEMGVATCYEGDLVMSSCEIGACLSRNICDGAEKTNWNNPSKSTGADRDVETCSDRCSSDISKDRIFVTLESKSVSEVENRDETVSNVGNTLTTERGNFVEVNNAAIEMRGLHRHPRLEVLITYSRKRRKNSSAPASSLSSIMTDAASSFPIIENKAKTASSNHYQVSLSYCSDNLPEEVITGDSTLLTGVQQMLLEKAPGDSSCSEAWNKKEIIQLDDQEENINSSMVSIKDECPIDSKVENSEQENRNETDATVNVAYEIESTKESSHCARSCGLGASNDTNSMITTNETVNGERQSAIEDSPHSRTSAFVDGKTQITNMAVIPPLGGVLNAPSSKKLLVLDVNGLLADIVPVRHVPYNLKADIIVSGKAVFRRPFLDDFLQFCFERFNVGVWSSRIKKNMELVLDVLLGNAKHKLVFCWDQSHCTDTGFPVVGKRRTKPIILKKLKMLWDKYEPDLPWERGEYDESNTLLLDDSPHKALCNPPNTAIFPNSYHYMDEKDDSLAGPGGDLRVYLEGLSMAENVQKYVESNPFGQRPITEKNVSWRYYRKVIDAATYLQESGTNKFSTYRCRY